MSITFNVRGDSFDARVSNAGKHGIPAGYGQIDSNFIAKISADINAIGGQTIDMSQAEIPRVVLWPGFSNLPSATTKTISFGVRIRFQTFNINQRLFCIGSSFNINSLSISAISGTDLILDASDGYQGLLSPVSYAHGLSSTTQYNDIVVTWDGTNNVGAIKMYLNGVPLGTWTPTRGMQNTYCQSEIVLGGNNTVACNNQIYCNEIVIADEVWTPEFIAATFIGPARTQFFATTPFDGLSWPLPGKVVSGTSWNEFGVAKNGARIDAPVGKVINTQSYGDPGAQLTGTYKPVPVDKVEAGYTFGTGAGEVGTLITGCDYPSEDDVVDGVVYANGTKTGTFGKHIPLTNGYWAPLETQKEIYRILSADVDLQTLLNNESLSRETIYDDVPQDVVFPYVSMVIMPFTPRDNATYDGLESDFQLNVFYQPGTSYNIPRGNKPVQLIQKRIDDLLQKRNLCIDGWNALQLRRSFVTIETDEDNVTKHGIQRYKLYLGEK